MSQLATDELYNAPGTVGFFAYRVAIWSSPSQLSSPLWWWMASRSWQVHCRILCGETRVDVLIVRKCVLLFWISWRICSTSVCFPTRKFTREGLTSSLTEIPPVVVPNVSVCAGVLLQPRFTGEGDLRGQGHGHGHVRRTSFQDNTRCDALMSCCQAARPCSTSSWSA